MLIDELAKLIQINGVIPVIEAAGKACEKIADEMIDRDENNLNNAKDWVIKGFQIRMLARDIEKS